MGKGEHCLGLAACDSVFKERVHGNRDRKIIQAMMGRCSWSYRVSPPHSLFCSPGALDSGCALSLIIPHPTALPCQGISTQAYMLSNGIVILPHGAKRRWETVLHAVLPSLRTTTL